MPVRLLTDHRRMPWANGSGVSHEIARFPAAGDFDWRVSLAEISESGAFSVLPCIDRVLVLTHGGHITLTEGTESTVLTEMEPHSFPGESVIASTLGDGPARDLNVMVRRGRVTAHVEVVEAGEQTVDPQGADIVVVAVRGTTTINGHALRYPDAASLTGATFVSTDGLYIRVDLRPVA